MSPRPPAARPSRCSSPRRSRFFLRSPPPIPMSGSRCAARSASPTARSLPVTHDWVFDEMYSSFATQGLAKPGELVKREIFAPLAQENAGGLAEIGYFTTLKLDGKAAEFGPVDATIGWRSGPTISSPSTSTFI